MVVGYWKLTNLQWGLVFAGTHNFPIPFTEKVFNIVAGASEGSGYIAGGNAKSLSTYKVTRENVSGEVQWVALGT